MTSPSSHSWPQHLPRLRVTAISACCLTPRNTPYPHHISICSQEEPRPGYPPFLPERLSFCLPPKAGENVVTRLAVPGVNGGSCVFLKYHRMSGFLAFGPQSISSITMCRTSSAYTYCFCGWVRGLRNVRFSHATLLFERTTAPPSYVFCELSYCQRWVFSSTLRGRLGGFGDCVCACVYDGLVVWVCSGVGFGLQLDGGIVRRKAGGFRNRGFEEEGTREGVTG